MLRLSPPNYEKIVTTHDFIVNYGGAEANVAVSLANLGVDSTFFTVLPNTDLGKSTINYLKANDVHTKHIIEAIGIAEPRTMSMISKSLGVTMGTLTTGINGLVRKGYVVRNRSDRDRRIVYASLTEKGIAAYHHHMKFHKSMIDSIMQDLSEDEAVVLNKTFNRLETFFGQWTDKH